jgi:hypothetical protein
MTAGCLKHMNNRESFLEIIWIIKTSLTTFWFWVPVLVGIIPLFELWIIITFNPLAAFALPAVVAAGVLIIDDKRTRARYQMGDKNNPVIHPVGTGSEFLANWDAQKKVKEYLEALDKKDEN